MSVLDKKPKEVVSAYDQDEGQFMYHQACLKCESSDGLAVYQKQNEEGETYIDGFCWVCSNYFPHSKLTGEEEVKVSMKGSEEKSGRLTLEEVSQFETRGSRQRKIKKSYMEMYGVKMDFKESGAVNTHYYPVTKNNEIVGYKPRKLPKDFKLSQVGDTKKGQLFGQWLFEGGKYPTSWKFVIITEGELDAIAVQQSLKEHGNPDFTNPVVSLNHGAGSAVKDIEANWKWLNKFENVILMFDNDEVGKESALAVAKKMPLGKCKIAKLSEKDPCEMLKKDKGSEIKDAMWKAETYAPDGVLAGAGLWSLVTTPLTKSDAHYPWEGLDKMLHGIRPAEMITLTAGSGVSKSTFARILAHHLQKTTDDNIGMIFLEESVKKTAMQILSLEAGKQFHLPETEYTEDEIKEAFDGTLASGQYYYFDDFASQDFDSIVESILYMAKAANCKYIFLDHISMLVSGGDYGDERKALDAICTKLRSMVQQLDITLFAITHLKRPPGTPHEEGGQTSLAQLRGSAGIAQLSDIVIGFERNGQADDPTEKHTTHARILKNRFSGETGLACSVLYDPDTGLVRELSKEEVESMDTESTMFEEIEESDSSRDFPDEY